MSVCLPTWHPVCMNVFLHGIMSVCLSAYMGSCLSVCLPTWYPVCLSAYMASCLSVCLSAYMVSCMSVYLHGILSVYMPVCLCLCQPVKVFVFHLLSSEMLWIAYVPHVSDSKTCRTCWIVSIFVYDIYISNIDNLIFKHISEWKNTVMPK